MNERSNRGSLRRAAQRAAAHRFFVASDLAAWQELHHMGEEALAEFLDCPPDQLPRLALCRRPDPAGRDFRSEVERIAAHVGARAERLARLMREVEAARALRQADRPETQNGRGMLLAARDRMGEQAPDSGPTATREAADTPGARTTEAAAGDEAPEQ